MPARDRRDIEAEHYRTEVARQANIISDQAEMIHTLTIRLIEAEQARATEVVTELMRAAWGISGDARSFEDWRAEKLAESSRPRLRSLPE